MKRLNWYLILFLTATNLLLLGILLFTHNGEKTARTSNSSGIKGKVAKDGKDPFPVADGNRKTGEASKNKTGKNETRETPSGDSSRNGDSVSSRSPGYGDENSAKKGGGNRIYKARKNAGFRFISAKEYRRFLNRSGKNDKTGNAKDLGDGSSVVTETGENGDSAEKDDGENSEKDSSEDSSKDGEDNEEPEKGAIAGYVVDEDNAPVEGAVVTLSLEQAGVGTDVAGQGGAFPRTYKTGSEGRFIFRRLDRVNYSMKVESAGFVTGYFASLTLDDGPETYVEAVLKKSMSVSGTVLDENDVPLEGARVTASYMIEAGITFNSETATDVSGSFVLPVQQDSTNVIEASKYGYKTARLLSIPQGKADCRIVLESLPTGTVTGRVVDAFTGDPISIISVDGVRLTTDDGYFQIERVVQKGQRTMLIGADGYPDMGVKYRLEAVETVNIGEVKLSSGLTLSGMVVEAGSEPVKPVSGAVVSVTVSSGVKNTFTTDVDGGFSISSLPMGPASIRAEAEGYNTYNNNMNLQPPSGEDGSREIFVEISLAPGAYSVSGVVRDEETGDPLQGVKVSILESPGLSTISDNSGGYAIESISMPSFRVTGSLEGYARYVSEPLSLSSESPSANCSFTMVKSSGFRGVLFRNGSPLPAGKEVIAWKRVLGGIDDLHAADANAVEHVFKTTVENGGKFVFEACKPGDYFLHVPEYRLLPTPVEVTENSGEMEINVPGVCDLRGRAVYSDGGPVANTTIWLHDGDHDYSTGDSYHTDSGGYFVIPNLARRKYALSIIKSVSDQSAQHVREITVDSAPEQSADVRFPALKSEIYGRLTDEHGNPKPGVHIGVEYLDSPHRAILAGWALTDDNGCYAVPRLEAGRHVVRTAWTEDEVVFSDKVKLEEGEKKKIDLVAPRIPARQITGYMTAADGGPLYGSFVFAVDADGRQSGNYFGSFKWEYTSAFRIVGLKPGSYKLIFTAMGCRKKTVEVNVESNISDYIVKMPRE